MRTYDAYDANDAETTLPLGFRKRAKKGGGKGEGVKEELKPKE